mmetsp:Transcript_26131/g.38657  ORF Transcript_26131/g.38657 Transcript_26131/m.38657 type:complete len:113 (-) Transcript_26131:9-347(-)
MIFQNKDQIFFLICNRDFIDGTSLFLDHEEMNPIVQTRLVFWRVSFQPHSIQRIQMLKEAKSTIVEEVAESLFACKCHTEIVMLELQLLNKGPVPPSNVMRRLRLKKEEGYK